eukprot:TRINITY_DN13495_c0_g2_i2.p1 TRINITY_DN13495_c0_g2~~TRINITY_DN13495_c0_g2_i2.p1  ORF type:complete len:254 (-),score=26.05 TRINITY_DN13495_c0_g2_i2:11-772(-)
MVSLSAKSTQLIKRRGLSSVLELNRIAQRVKLRREYMKDTLDYECKEIASKLKFNSTSLSKGEAGMIASMLGFELNEYQKAELERTVTRARSFSIQQLKAWLLKSSPFLLRKQSTQGQPIPKAVNKSLMLPRIRRSTWRLSQHEEDTDKPDLSNCMETIAKHSKLKRDFQKRLQDALEMRRWNSGMQGMKYSETVRQRLSRVVREKKEDFVRNVHLLALMQKNCYQMHRFKEIMLGDASHCCSCDKSILFHLI